MNCPECGTKNLTDTKFCPTCGFNLEIDKKLEELRESSPSLNYPPPVATCYCPAPGYREKYREELEKKNKRLRYIKEIVIKLVIGLIIVSFILLLAIIGANIK